MRLYIPYWINGVLPPTVIKSIGAQTIQCEIVVISTLRTRNRDSEYENRNMIFDLAKAEDVFLMQDSDVSHKRTDNIHSMLHYLAEHPTVGYVALRHGAILVHTNHVDIGCCAVRRLAIKDSYLTQQHSECCCVGLKNLVESNGYVAKYLDAAERIQLELRQ